MVGEWRVVSSSVPVDSAPAARYVRALSLVKKQSPPPKYLVRDLNRSAILRLIGRDGPIARAQIARELGLSPATVTNVTRELIETGLIQVVDQAPSRGGRPALLLAMVGSAAHALGVKLSPDHLVGVRVTLDAEVVERFELPFDAASGYAIEELIRIITPHTRNDESGPLLLGVGLGVPGIVDTAEQRVVDSPLLGWKDVPLGEVLQRALGVPVLVDNDVNTLAIAERLYGRGRSQNHFVTVTIGRGVGLGIIAAGDVYRGANGGAGEFGHVSMAAEGPPCECGRSGCLEALVSDPALVRQGVDVGVLRPDDGIHDLRRLASTGDLGAIRIFGSAGETLGRAVAGLVSVLAPELVLVSGEGTQAWPFIEAAFRSSFAASVFPSLQQTPIEVDPWDDGKWARGAAALVLRATLVTAVEEERGGRMVRERLGAPIELQTAVAG